MKRIKAHKVEKKKHFLIVASFNSPKLIRSVRGSLGPGCSNFG